MHRKNVKGLALVLSLLFLLAAVPADARWQQAVLASETNSLSSSPTFVAAREAAERIKAERMKEDLYVIASDEFAGRDTPSPGLDKTAKLISDRLAKAKLIPAGDDGTYLQKILLRSTEVDREKTSAALGARRFRAGEHFLPAGRVSGEVEAPLVYAGHGWIVKSKKINAYDGLDVKGKIVVVSGDGRTPPPGTTLKELTDAPGGSWESPISYAQKQGAVGLVFIPRNFERRWRYGSLALARPSYGVARFEDDSPDAVKVDESKGVPAIIPSREMLNAIFTGEKVEGPAILQTTMAGEASKGFALSPDKRLRISVNLKNSEATTHNIVAILEGRDKQLKREHVAIGAHYDHVGEGRPVNGDAIYNGADDDGSGTTALLHMAEAFAKGPRPKRSILFVWHTAEEKGLWGSEYFTRYPTVPLENVVAQLNIDMIGRSKLPGDTNPKNRMLTGPDEIYVIGSKMMSTELGQLSEAVNEAYLGLKFNYHYDQPNDPEQLFYRSDHYNYAKRGVPIIFYFDGVHEDYHQPSDTPDKIDYRKMERITRTVFILASELANRPERPIVDKQLEPDRFSR